jgi:hypothetical protein
MHLCDDVPVAAGTYHVTCPTFGTDKRLRWQQLLLLPAWVGYSMCPASADITTAGLLVRTAGGSSVTCIGSGLGRGRPYVLYILPMPSCVAPVACVDEACVDEASWAGLL